MDLNEADPWWLPWVLPVTSIIGVFGGTIVFIGRKILLPGLKDEISELLKDKFAEMKMDVMERHEDNEKDIRRIESQLRESMQDRKKMQQDIAEVKSDVSYLRGKSTGTFKRP